MALTKIKTAAIADDAVTTDKLADAINTERTANTAKDLTALSAANLTSGTIPDARFPATLPAASAANLTAVPAANITGTLPAISAANLTNVPAANITGTLPAISGANLTNLPASGKATNFVINGAMTVAQRGTSFSPTGSAYTLDRFKQHVGSSFNMDTTITQATDAPSGFTNSLKISPDSTATPSGSENATILHKIEGNVLDALAHGTSDAKQVTLSFYAKSASTNNNQVYTVQLTKRNTGGTKYYLTQTFTVTSSWQRFTMTFAADTTNNLKNDNTEGMAIYWHLGSGPDDIVSLQSTWLANNGFRAATGQSNFFDNTSNEFYLTGVQLELGDTATDYAHESYGETLMKCYRYYQLIARGSDGSGDARTPLVSGSMWGTANFYGVLPFKNRMRSAPSLEVTTGTDYYQVYHTTSDTCDNIGYNNTSPDAITLHLTQGLSGTAAMGGWSRTNHASAFVAATAEL